MARERALAAAPHVLRYHEDWEPVVDALAEAYAEVAPWLLRDETEPRPECFFLQLARPLRSARVCVVGVDPYPEGATGVPFESPDFSKRSARALAAAVARAYPVPPYRNYSLLRVQGVLAWNYYLSCRRGEPRSHALHWEQISRLLLAHIARFVSVFYFLGKSDFAQVRAKLDAPVTLLVGYHPAARGGQFESERTFEIVNALLELRGQPPVDWRAGFEPV
ncbi:uracil-DNA glycosylase [Equine molluscum contagiosum-like virus]|nr:uracil-DNA glycosylase [Equine molluscum contagiosum-like virus]